MHNTATQQQTSSDPVAKKSVRQWQGVRVSQSPQDVDACIHSQNVHVCVNSLVRLVSNQVTRNPETVAKLHVCTSNVGIVNNPHGSFKMRPSDDNAHPVSAAWPTLQDGDRALSQPALYGLLCTVFEWFRVAIDGAWTVGPYDMRHWEFLNAVAPIPYVHERDAHLAQYCMCSRTGFRKWTPLAMYNLIKCKYNASEFVTQCLQSVVK